MYRRLLKAALLALTVMLTLMRGTEAAPAVTNDLRLPPLKAGRTRPLVAIVADNAGTETTDLLVPYGVLKEADVADVVIVSTHPGAVNLMPALRIEAEKTLEAFDSAHQTGADIVVVPALHDDRNETIIRWVRAQADKGAFVLSICEGAWIPARAGLLEGRSATTHWYAFDSIARAFPQARWTRDRRYVVDGNIMTTTGVSASIPASLSLVEAIAGRAKAAAVASRLGIDDWGAEHDSSAFHLTAGRMWSIARNAVLFWKHETWAIPIADGVDEIALALTADAWSRTYRSQAIAVSTQTIVRSRRGLTLLPSDTAANVYRQLALPKSTSAGALQEALGAIAGRYGSATADIVALQLEYGREAQAAAK